MTAPVKRGRRVRGCSGPGTAAEEVMTEEQQLQEMFCAHLSEGEHISDDDRIEVMSLIDVIVSRRLNGKVRWHEDAAPGRNGFDVFDDGELVFSAEASSLAWLILGCGLAVVT